MPLLLVVAWVVVTALLVVTALGPRRWWTNVTSQLRPDRVEPTGPGYALLSLRNTVVTLAALAVVVPVTVDWARVSPQELTETARDVVARVPDDDLDLERFRLEMEDRLHRDVYVESVELDDDGTAWRVTLTDPEEGDAPDDSDSPYEGPAVTCFEVIDADDGTQVIGAINPGPCSG